MLENIIITVIILYISFFLYKIIIFHAHQQNPVIANLKWKLSLIYPEVLSIPFYINNRKEEGHFCNNKKEIYLYIGETNKTIENKIEMNTLMYISLHELAHILCPDFDGHSPSFFSIFDSLKKKAIEKHIYDPNIPLSKQYYNHSSSVS